MTLSKLIYLSLSFLFCETEKKVLPNRRRVPWDGIRETGDPMRAHRACAHWVSVSLWHSEQGERHWGWGPDRIEWNSEILHHQLCDLAWVHAKSLQSCPTLCNRMDCNPPSSSVHGILQAGILELVAMPSSRGDLPGSGIKPMSPALTGKFFTTEPSGKF